MEKKTGLNWWCNRAWIYFGTCISIVMMVVILINWNSWSDALKVMAAIAMLIPIHVIEEWVFPGGFHYQYNTFMYKSDQPDRYPMCRVSDMITNLGATFMYIAFTIIFATGGGDVNTGIIMGSIGFCALELILHVGFGTAAYFRFRKQGKKTIYGPGTITCFWGFVPFGIILIYEMQGRTITGADWGWCAFVLCMIAFVWILIPENLIKKKNNKYFFASHGYYDRYLKK